MLVIIFFLGIAALYVRHIIAYVKRDHQRVLAEKAYLRSIDHLLPRYITKVKGLEYIVNNREIPCTHERYYYIKLGLPLPIIRLDRDVIERHYLIRTQEQETDIQVHTDVEAANMYFNDRLNYLAHLN